MAYRPNNSFNVPLLLLIPTVTTVNGVRKKTFPAVTNGILFNGSFKTYGGTERNVNGIYSVEDTAEIETWYRPDITADCRIVNAATGAIYDVITPPENIEMRNQFMAFKVTRVKGGV